MREKAEMIIKQMGGYGKLKAMVNLRDLTYSNKTQSVAFKFSGNKEINYCKITLTEMDTYNIEFGKIWGSKYKVKSEVKDIYNDMLNRVFTEETGLDTHL